MGEREYAVPSPFYALRRARVSRQERSLEKSARKERISASEFKNWEGRSRTGFYMTVSLLVARKTSDGQEFWNQPFPIALLSPRYAGTTLTCAIFGK